MNQNDVVEVLTNLNRAKLRLSELGTLELERVLDEAMQAVEELYREKQDLAFRKAAWKSRFDNPQRNGVLMALCSIVYRRHNIEAFFEGLSKEEYVAKLNETIGELSGRFHLTEELTIPFTLCEKGS